MKTHIGEIELPLKRIHLELTNVCNFDCIFCPKFKMSRPYGYMELDLAKKLITEIAENKIAEKITFHVMGEPLMHKNFTEILHHAQENGIEAGITNNGSFLNENAADMMVDNGVSQVNISLQTPNKESYKTRVAHKLEFDAYRNNILSFIKRGRERNPEMKLKLHFLNTTYSKKIEKVVGELHVMKGNSEIRSNLIHWADMICDQIGVERSEREGIYRKLNTLQSHQWNVVEIVPGIFFETYILNSWGDGLRDENTVVETSIGYCSGLQDHFAVLWDGRMTYCCKDFDGKTASSINLKEMTIMEALKRDEIQDVVKGFKSYKVNHPHCRRCLGGSSKISSFLGALSSIFIWKLLKSYFYRETRCFKN